MSSENLSEYEKRRLENIRRNQQVLLELQVPTIGLDVEKGGHKLKSKSRKVIKIESAPLVRRTSSRLRDGPVDDSINFIPIISHVEGERKQRKKSTSRILFNPSVNIDAGTGSETIRLPAQMDYLLDTIYEWNNTFDNSTYGDSKYTIKNESSFVKVAQERIYTVAFHPMREKLLCHAGTKAGNLVFWDCTDNFHDDFKPLIRSEMDKKSFTCHVQLHGGAIFAQKYDPRSPGHVLYTASYDNTMRSVDLSDGRCVTSTSFTYGGCKSGLGEWICAMDHTPDGSSWFLSDSDGWLTSLDPRTGKDPHMTERLHEKKIGAISVSPMDPFILATGSLDRSIRIWDRRMLSSGNAIYSVTQPKAVTAVSFNPHNRESLVSTCWDDTVRIWSQTTSQEPVLEHEVKHNNQTGRWITPFRAFWDSKKDPNSIFGRIIIGNMQHGLDCIDGKTGTVTSSYCEEYLTSQPAANAVHPNYDVVASGNATGRIFIWTPSLT